jgi:hypothetical protein
MQLCESDTWKSKRIILNAEVFLTPKSTKQMACVEALSFPHIARSIGTTVPPYQIPIDANGDASQPSSIPDIFVTEFITFSLEP